MIKIPVLLLFFTFFLTLACEQGIYKRIQVETAWGKEIIPSTCSAWTDGCNIYCRVGPTDYTNPPAGAKQKCTKEDITHAVCIDEDPEKLEYCGRKE